MTNMYMNILPKERRQLVLYTRLHNGCHNSGNHFSTLTTKSGSPIYIVFDQRMYSISWSKDRP